MYVARYDISQFGIPKSCVTLYIIILAHEEKVYYVV